jgi:alanine dehydrogenase
VLSLANLGWKRAAREMPGLGSGLNIVRGRVVHAAVARSLGLPSAVA